MRGIRAKLMRSAQKRMQNAHRCFGARAVRTIGMACLCGALAWIAIAEPVGAQSKVDEYKLKAAFVFHFAEMTDWPAAAFGANQNEITLCTVGNDPFAGELESTLAGKAIGQHAVRIRHAKQAAETRGCQIVFVGSGEMKLLPEVLAQIGNSPVMTVGESDGFLQQGGMFSFCLDGNKIRFEINVAPAERAGLKISSRLLMLARNVMGNHGQG